MVTKTVEVGRDKNPMQVTGWRDSKGVVHYTDPGWSYNPGERMWLSAKEIAEKEKAVLGAVGAPVVAQQPIKSGLTLPNMADKKLAKLCGDAFNDCDFPELKVVVEKYAPYIKKVEKYNGKGSNYSDGDRRIRLGTATRKAGDESTARTFRHEMGHHVDLFCSIWDRKINTGMWASGEKRFKEAMMKDAIGVMSTGSRNLELAADLSLNGKYYDNPAISDICDALTHSNIVGNWGHFQEYYKARGALARNKQIFANMVDVFAKGGDDALYVKRMFPEMSRVFIEMIRETAI
jgi:hypothetical protein